jgi:arabinose-5-phosphate isomerase
MTQTHDADLALGRSVIATERAALEQLEASLGPSFGAAVDVVLAASNYTIIAGVGKSGHIGNKIAASLASTGTPSFFLHPTEASHGDLGMVAAGCVVIAISYSGESREMVDLLQYCRSHSVPVIGMTRSAASTLGKMSDVVLEMPVVAEACPNGLAPTSSTTMSLALGDALTVAVMERRGFSREDFGQRHPGGKLGRGLQTAGDYVAGRHNDIPSVSAASDARDVVLAVSEGRRGCVAVLDDNGALIGMVTDGDLRRAFVSGTLDGTARDIMTENPRTIAPDERMSAVIERMTQARISNGFVVRDGKPIGTVDMKDLLAEGYL